MKTTRTFYVLGCCTLALLAIAAGKRITDFTAATTIADTDAFELDTGTASRRASFGTLAANLATNGATFTPISASRLPRWSAFDPTNTFFVFDGDSHTIRLNQYAPITNFPAFLNMPLYCNCTVRDLADIRAGYATNISTHVPTNGQVGIYVLWTGDHDYQSSYGFSAWATVSNLNAHLYRVKTNGFLLAQLTTTAVFDAPDPISRSNLYYINTWTRTNDLVDFKIDVDARFPDPAFDRVDGVHFNNSNYVQIAEMLDYTLRNGPNKTITTSPWQNSGTNYWLWDPYRSKPLAEISYAGALTINKIGIGTTNPVQQLDIYGSAQTGPAAAIHFGDTSASANSRNWMIGNSIGVLDYGFFGINSGLSAGGAVSTATRFAIDRSGNVGIGTNTPFARLHVIENAADSGDLVVQFGTTVRNDLANLKTNGLWTLKYGTLYSSNAVAMPTAAQLGTAGSYWTGTSNGSLVTVYTLDGSTTAMKVLAP